MLFFSLSDRAHFADSKSLAWLKADLKSKQASFERKAMIKKRKKKLYCVIQEMI